MERKLVEYLHRFEGLEIKVHADDINVRRNFIAVL